MVYGVLKLINFAHSDVYMLGAYAGFFAVTLLGLPFFPALILAMIFCALVGMSIERSAYRPVRAQGGLTALITAMGVSLLLENLGIMVFGAAPKSFPEIITTSEVFHWRGLIIGNKQLYIIITSLFLMFLLNYIVNKTKIGRAMRAVSFDQNTSKLMGINVDHVISITFAIGSALAAAGGVLISLYYLSINPLMGVYHGLKAFVAAVLGGIGNIPGAMLGGILMGIAEIMVVGYVSSTYRDAIAFMILILVLLLRPAGLLGKNSGEKI